MHRHFLPTGRVRYFPCCEWVPGADRFVSRLTGEPRPVHVRRKLVDTTYIEGTIPATSPPPFEVAEGVRCIPPGDLPRLGQPAPERYVIIGGGKTALDSCVWLLEQGVAPAAIRWIRPRDAWWMNRKFQQPHTLLPDLLYGTATQIEAMALAGSAEEVLARLESEKIFLRVDPDVVPTMFRGAIVSEPELELLRRIEDVVRMGRVRRIERDTIVLEGGRVPTDAQTVHVHCAARGLARPPLRPIFEPRRVTVQAFRWGFSCYHFEMLGVIEATVVGGDEQKNALCPPFAVWDVSADYLTAFLATMVSTRAMAAHPKLAGWAKTSRLNPLGAVAAHRDDPRVVASQERVKRFGIPAAMNLRKLLSPHA
jgi:hypothetical protein